MKLQIGENVKRLRQNTGITQEQLADALGVSCQSVSRWELGICYPDMELLPAIANYFDVSTDSLLGMDAIRSEEKRCAIFTEALSLERQEKWSAAIEVLENALRIHPNDDGLQTELALVLSQTGVRKDQLKAVSLSEHILEHSTDEKLRCTARANLCFLYKATGQQEKALALGRSLPHIWESREILLPDLVDTAERGKMLRCSLNIMVQVLKDLIANQKISFSLGYKPEADVRPEDLLQILK